MPAVEVSRRVLGTSIEPRNLRRVYIHPRGPVPVSGGENKIADSKTGLGREEYDGIGHRIRRGYGRWDK